MKAQHVVCVKGRIEAIAKVHMQSLAQCLRSLIFNGYVATMQNSNVDPALSDIRAKRFEAK